MPVSLSSMVLHIGADTKDAESGLDRVNNHVGRMGGLVGITSLAFTGGMGAIASGVMEAGRALKGMLTNAEQAQAVSTQLNQVLQSTGGVSGVTRDAIDHLADKMSTLTLYTDEAYRASATVMLGFTRIGKTVFPEAQKAAADVAARLGIDLTAAAKKVGLALEDPERGMNRLRQLQIILTDKQKESIKTFQEQGNMIGAQNVLLDALRQKFGGAAEAAGKTLSGQLTILRNRFEELSERVGLTFLPAINAIVTAFTTVFIALTDKLQPALDALEEVFTEAGKAVVDFWQKSLAPFGQALTDVGRNLLFLRDIFLNAFLEAFGAVEDTMSPATQAVKLFGDAASDVGTNLHGIWQQVSAIFTQTNYIQAVNTIGRVLRDLGTFLGGAFRTVFAQFVLLWQQLRPQLQAAMPFIVQMYTNFLNIAKALLPLAQIINPIWALFRQFAPIIFSLLPPLYQLGAQLSGAILKGLQQIVPPLMDAANALMVALAPAVSTIVDVLKVLIPIVGDLLSTAFNTIAPIIAMVARLIGTVLAPILGRIIVALQPVIQQVGVWIGQLAHELGPLITAIGSLIMKVLPPVFNVVGAALNILLGVFQFVWPTLRAIVDVAINAIRNVIKIVTAAISGDWGGVWNGILNLVKGIMGGIFNVVGTLMNSIWQKIKDFGGFIFDALTKPFMLARDAVGAIFKGLANFAIDAINNFVIKGINDFIGKIATAIDWVADKLHAGKPLANAEHGLIGTIPRFAKGGVMNASGLALVGEEGPEIVHLPSGSRISPMGAMGGDIRNDQGPLGNLAGVLGDMVDWFIKGPGALVDAAFKALGVPTSLNTPFGDIYKMFKDAAKGFVDGILGQAGGDVGNALKSPGYHWWMGNIIQGFHPRSNPAHGGIDFHAAYHTPLVALLGGTVYRGDYRPWGGELDLWANLPGYGRGLENYTHLDYILPQYTKPGAFVPSGAIIGLSGGQPRGGLHPAHGFSGGPHLHYNWFVNRPWAHDDLNPTPFINSLRRQKNFGDGGWVTEPVYGYGVRSGDRYTIAERGPEYVGAGGSGGRQFIINVTSADQARIAADVAKEIKFQEMVRG